MLVSRITLILTIMSPLAAEIFEVRNCFRCLTPLMHFYMLPLPIFIHKTVKGGFFLLL